MRLRIAIPGALVVLGLTAAVPAQELGLRGPEPKQIAQGGRAVLELSWDLAQGEEVRLLEPPRVRGLTFDVVGPSRYESQSMSNGRVVSERRLTWQVAIQGLVLGKHEIPPFRVQAGNNVFRSKPTTLTVVEDVQAKDAAWFELELPTEAHWVGERVEIVLRFGIDESVLPAMLQGDLRRNVVGAVLQVPWLAEPGFGVPLARAERPDDFGVGIGGMQALTRCRLVGSRTRGGREYRVFELRRGFRLTRPGRHELEAPSLTFEYATEVRRGPFGDLQVVSRARAFVRAAGGRLEVRALPSEGRPADFVDAVGRFRLHAEVDRRTLELGESLRLSLRIEGEGGFGFLTVPELDDLPGFHRYSRDLERAADHVVARYELAPVDPAVHEVPALELPYFDPGTGRYERARSEPIPLTLRRPEGATEVEALPDRDRGVQPGVDDIHDRMLLDGLPRRPLRPGLGLVALSQLVPVLFLLAAWALLRRSARLRADPLGRRARRALERFGERLDRDGPLRAFSVFVAARLGWGDGEAVGAAVRERLVGAGLADATAERTADLLQRLQASRYGSGSDESALAQEARELARAIEAELRR